MLSISSVIAKQTATGLLSANRLATFTRKKKSRYDVLRASAEHELHTSRHTDSELRHSEDQTKPALTDQDQTSQDRTRPQQLRPIWARPDQTKPEQIIPDQAKPIESIPEQTSWD